jgi:hypothetical protein
MRQAVVFAVLALMVPAYAAAHQKSVSYSKWTLLDDGAVAQARVRWLELTSVPEALGDAAAEVDREQVLAYLQERLTLETDGQVCRPREGSEVWLPSDPGWIRVEWRVECEGAPERLRSRLFTTLANHVHLATVFRPDPFDVVISPTAPAAEIAGDGEGVTRGVADYFRLGVEHILTGWDHLAFLLLLIVVAPRVRDLAVLVTGFTVGHSITLGAAALGLVIPNATAVEAAIAASILVVALENAGVDRSPSGRLVVALAVALFIAAAAFGHLPAFWGIALFTACYFGLLRALGDDTRLRWAIACLFGLVHGLGFSSVLAEQELSSAELVRALLGFNLGVEAGQLALVVLAWPVLRFLQSRERGELLVDVTSVAGAALGVFVLVVRVFG